MVKIKISENIKFEDMEQLEQPYVVDGNVKQHVHFGKRSGSFLWNWTFTYHEVQQFQY